MPIESAVSASSDGPASIDALVAAAGLDPGQGVQVVPAARASQADASLATIVLTTGPGDPSALLAKYPPETPLTPLLDDGEGGVAAGAVATVGAVAAARSWERPEVVALALPALPAEDVRGDLRGLVGVIHRVRDPEGGCPWDLAQDHQSLRPHLLEETYEVLEAIDGLPQGDGLARGDGGTEAWAALREELGDLLMQIVLHARLAEQGGRFTLGEVAEGIRAKLVRRHPHVFGEDAASTPAEVERNWDQLKAAETKPGGARRESALDGVPPAMPALARAQKLAGRAGRRGFAWESDGDVLAKLAEELAEVAAAPAPERAGEVGDVLFVVCDFLRRQGVEAEDALREACGKFERRFRALEASLRAEGLAMESAGQAALLRRWEAVKAGEGG